MEINLNSITEIDNQNLDSFLGNKLESLSLIYNEQILNLGYASLTSQEWLFDGIRIGYSSWNFQEPSVIKWEFDAPVDFITLYFNLKGFTKTFRKDQPDKEYFNFSNYQHNVLYTPGNKGELRSDGFELRTFMIKIPKHAFIIKTQDSNEGLKRFSDRVLNNQSSILSEKSLFLDMAMHNAIHAIVNCKIEGSLKKIFLHAKCMELLVLQADAHNISLYPTSSYVKSNYDKELFFYARDYLEQNLSAPPSLPELSKILGINEFKLKKGFKEIFGNTVFGFISDKRLDLARRSILEENKTISEIALELGYSSTQHFSAAFKNKFGFPPINLRS